MKIGIGLPNQVRDVRAAVIPAWAARAEEAGFATLATVGRTAYPGVQDTVALAAAAGATSTIGLLSSVLLAPVWPATLLAKELAGIDGVSGGRLTLGLGIGGNRPDDFVVDGLPAGGLGKRMDQNLEVYRDVWRGEPVGGGTNAAVPAGTRQIPMLFGGFAPAALRRMAAWGDGWISGALPASMVEAPVEAARGAWREAGRDGAPRLVMLAYFGFGDTDKGRANVYDYYIAGGKDAAELVSGNVAPDAATVQSVVKAYDAMGADELIFLASTDDIDEVARLADAIR